MPDLTPPCRGRISAGLAPGLCAVLLLACGGGRTALDPDDGQGGKRRRADAGVPEGPDAGKGDGAPVRAAIHLTASTDDPSGVLLRWTTEGELQPTAYVIRRDDQDVSMLKPPGHAILDISTEPGSVSAVASLRATQGTRTDAVGLTWSAASTAIGASHLYQVVAVDGETKLAESEKVTGARGAPTLLGYEFSRDDGVTWQFAGTGTSFDDTGAPLGTISARAEASARYPLGYVRLQVTAEPTVGPVPPSMYRVRAKTSTEPGPASPRATGFRGVGKDVSYQWQRSAGNRDADYRDLDDVTGSLWFDDTAPLEESRFFRAVVRADGATGATAAVPALVKRFQSVTVGSAHSCGIVSDGKRICWGPNGYGQAPPDFSTDAYRTVVASWADDVTCGIREDSGAVDCWGHHPNGSPRITPPAGSFRTISIGGTSGAAYLCGVMTDGSVGSVYCPIGKISGPVQAISAGNDFVCAILPDGSRVCSGTNSRGQAPPDPSPDKFRSIGAGEYFACGLRTDDSIVCWGQISLSWGPVASPVGAFKSLSVGRNAACAIDTQDKVRCLGLQAPSTEWRAPIEAGDAKFTSVSAGNASACGVREDGKVVCWGANIFGGAPQPPSKERFTSISVTDILGSNDGTICGVRTDGIPRCWGSWIRVPENLVAQHFKILSLGTDAICGVREDDKLVCWGDNSEGQAPPGPSSESFSAVSMGALDACGLKTDGKVACWGDSILGGDNPPDASFTTVSTGFHFACGLATDGRALCWGDSRDDRTKVPAGRFTAVSAGKWQACGLDSDQHAVCWGQTNSVVPPADTFKTISAAVGDGWAEQGIACGVRSDDRVVCWGKYLGADTPSRPTLDRYLDVQAGTCGIRTDHHVVCWGGLFGI
jgi:alpha-tubulin suppressor-like RCC1 family protein